jgi:hypothetical protein
MEAFVELLEEEEWLTHETKTFAKEKVIVSIFIFLLSFCRYTL